MAVGFSGGCTWAQQALQSVNSWATRHENLQMGHGSWGVPPPPPQAFLAKQTRHLWCDGQCFTINPLREQLIILPHNLYVPTYLKVLCVPTVLLFEKIHQKQMYGFSIKGLYAVGCWINLTENEGGKKVLNTGSNRKTRWKCWNCHATHNVTKWRAYATTEHSREEACR